MPEPDLNPQEPLFVGVEHDDYRWVPASEGEPPVTDKRFAVLLISYEDVDFYTKQKYTARYLRPHYPSSSPNDIPADCHWLLLPPIPEGS